MEQPVASTSRLVSSPFKFNPDKQSPSNAKGKQKELPTQVTESFLKRLAGPSTNKAGLKRDPEEVRRIIYEASKGSAFFINEQNRDAATTKQVEEMLQSLRTKLDQLHGNLKAQEAEVDQRLAYLEASEGHKLDETVVVIDADAFYASVEELDNPSLKGKAFGVGSGVLTTASYEARKYGVRSAMAGFVAKKLCPHLIFVKPDFSKYSAASKKIMDILRRYDENMAPASLDEAYMNITAYLKKTGQSAEQVVTEIRATVQSETGLTVSAGVGVNKMIAKIAADINKPDGQCIIPADRAQIKTFMHSMSVRKVPGIGRVTERWLEALDVVLIADIHKHRGKLNLVKNSMSLDFLLKAYLGLGSSNVEPGKREDRKSVGRETTFHTMFKEEELYAKLKDIAETVASDLERLHFSGRTITLKLKEDTYEPMTRGYTNSKRVFYSSFEDLYQIGKDLLDHELEARRKRVGKKDLRLRLLGLRVTNLRDELNPLNKEGALLDQWAKPSSDQMKKRKSLQPSTTNSTEDDAFQEPHRAQPAIEKAVNDHVKLLSASDQVLNDVNCPLCAKHFQATSTFRFNAHLDSCLKKDCKAEDRPPKKLKQSKDKEKQANKPKSAFSLLMASAKVSSRH